MKYVIICLLISITCHAQSVSALIDSSEIVYPNIALAISRHETGNQKSKLFTQHNNAFGFKGRKGYKHYDSLYKSIQEYLILESKVIARYKPNSDTQYLKYLSRRYARDPSWLRKIRKFL